MIRSLFALLFALCPAFAGQKAVQIPLKAAPLKLELPATAPLSVLPALVPAIPQAVELAQPAPQAEAAASQPESPEQQAAQASRRFDNTYAASAQAPGPVYAEFASKLRSGPSRFALVPAAARLIQKEHIDRPKAERLVGRALRGLLEKAGVQDAKTARPYFAALRRALSKKESGLGLSWSRRADGLPFVTEVAKGSPAEKAGVKGGDVLLFAGERELDEASPLELKQILETPSVELTVGRTVNGLPALETFKLEAAPYREPEFHRLIPGIVEVFEAAAQAFSPAATAAELLEASLQRMGGALDRFTTYFTKEEHEDFAARFQEHSYGGFGLISEPRVGGLQIRAVRPGSPAARAGLSPGDMIASIDGASAAGLTEDQADALLIRPEGEAASFVVFRRGGDPEPDEITLSAERLHLPLAGGRLLPGGAGYLYLVNFSEASIKEARDVLAGLKAKGMTSLVVDLRFNPGGQMSAAMDLAELFLPKGVLIARLDDGKLQDVVSEVDGEFRDLPLSVVVHGQTVSASELFAAAVRDNGRAVLVGQPSWGKGFGQKTFELTEGRAFKVTTLRWHRPSGGSLAQGRGLEPDVEVTPYASAGETLKRLQEGLFGDRLPGLEDPFIAAAARAAKGPVAWASTAPAAPSAPPGSARPAFSLVYEFAQMLSRWHISRPKTEALLREALNGMMAAGNVPFKKYPGLYGSLDRALHPTKRGLGLVDVLASPSDLPYVLEVAPGSPAHRAGIKKGSRLESLNGRSLKGISSRELKALLSQEGTLAFMVTDSRRGPSRFAPVAAADYFEPSLLWASLTAFFETAASMIAPAARAAELLEAALERMADGFDEFTGYAPPEEAEAFKKEHDGETYGGFGFVTSKRSSGQFVEAVALDSAADRAGLRRGDLILSVDGRPVGGLEPLEVVKLTRRAPGLPVTLVVAGPTGAERVVEMTAEVRRTRFAVSSLLPGGVGYVRFHQFAPGSDAGVQRAIDELAASGAKKLIIDLRFNGGGDTAVAGSLAGLFLPPGAEAGRVQGTPFMDAIGGGGDGRHAGMTVALLVNRHSASSSEVLAAALQEAGAVVVGEPTFGKGIGQYYFPMFGGRELRVTSFEWLTPSGRQVRPGAAVIPDVSYSEPEEREPFVAEELARRMFEGRGQDLSDAAVKAAWDALNAR